MEAIKEILDRRMGLVTKQRQLLDAAAAEKRPLTAEENQTYEQMDADVDRLSVTIDARRTEDNRRTKLAAFDADTAPLGKQVPSLQPGSRPLGNDGADAAAPFKYKLGKKGRSVLLAPGTPEHARTQLAYRKAFVQYLQGRGAESLGLQISSDPKGGYLAPVTLVNKLVIFLKNLVYMRQIATVLPPIDGKGIGVPSYDVDPANAAWTPEVPASALTEDTAATFGKREFIPHLCAKLIKLSQKITRSAVIDVEEFMAERLAYVHAITEETAFYQGTGNQQPLGLFTASTDGIDTSRDLTSSKAADFTGDDLIALKYNVKAVYINRSYWWFSREMVKRVRRLKDGLGQYLWVSGFAGQPDTVLDRPYVLSEYVPNTFTSTSYVACFGDPTFYWIGDSLDMEIQVLMELFALNNQIGMISRKETDGMPVLAEAFTRLQLA